MTFHLSPRSLERLEGVHPDLIKVVLRAIEITPVDFGVIQGKRTIEQQAENIISGASKKAVSRHLTGHAVDLGAYSGGKIVWMPHSLYGLIAKAMKQAAKELNIPIKWGGDWVTFRDYVHFELDTKVYPISLAEEINLSDLVRDAILEIKDGEA